MQLEVFKTNAVGANSKNVSGSGDKSSTSSHGVGRLQQLPITRAVPAVPHAYAHRSQTNCSSTRRIQYSGPVALRSPNPLLTGTAEEKSDENGHFPIPTSGKGGSINSRNHDRHRVRNGGCPCPVRKTAGLEMVKLMKQSSGGASHKPSAKGSMAQCHQHCRRSRRS